MVAYSFKKQFVAPLVAGTKIGTIRGFRTHPSRHARPGEQVQIYTGMRTKYVTLFGRATCQQTRRIILAIREGCVFYPDAMDTIQDDADLNSFAISDGFTDWGKLTEFWDRNHPGVYTFEGAHILWGDTLIPATAT